MIDDLIVPSMVEKLAATLGVRRRIGVGDALPAGWHSIFCNAAPLPGELAQDGLPASDPLLPVLELPRRLFGGTRMRLLSPLKVGEPISCHSEIAGIERKQARSGPLAIVRLQRVYSSAGTACVVEDQDVLYTGMPSADTANAPAARADTIFEAQWRRTVRCDEIALFRFSALTFNSHRIHYDSPFARGVEGQPALLAQAKLVALLALEVLRAEVAAPIAAIVYRSVHPVFAPGECEVAVALDAGQNAYRLQVSQNARPCMTLEVQTA